MPRWRQRQRQRTAAADSGKTVTAVTDAAKIGDSYYSWSMTTPKNFTMTDRTFDGTKTTFQAGKSVILIAISKADEDVSYDDDFDNVKSKLFSNMTLTASEKVTNDPSGIKSMHLSGKTSDYILDFRSFLKDGKNYDISTQTAAADSDEIKSEAAAIMSSFGIAYAANETYDLSNVESGYRTFKDDKYKISFKIPAAWIKSDASEAENKFIFVNKEKDSKQRLTLTVFSRSDSANAKTRSQEDREIISNYKKNKTEISDLTAVKAGENDAVEYTAKTTGTDYSDEYSEDIFFDLGSYTYNMTIHQNSDSETVNKDILSSFSASELDAAAIGNLVPDDTAASTRTVRSDSYSFTLPATWGTDSAADTTAKGFNLVCNSGYLLNVYNHDDMNIDNIAAASKYANYVAKEINAELEIDAQFETIKDKPSARLFKFVLKKTNKKGVTYLTYYVDVESKKTAEFIIFDGEDTYGGKSKTDILAAVDSIKFN